MLFRSQADTVETDTESLVSILSKHFGWIQFLEAKQNGHDSEKRLNHIFALSKHGKCDSYNIWREAGKEVIPWVILTR